MLNTLLYSYEVTMNKSCSIIPRNLGDISEFNISCSCVTLFMMLKKMPNFHKCTTAESTVSILMTIVKFSSHPFYGCNYISYLKCVFQRRK
jgi:hypothetical protein